MKYKYKCERSKMLHDLHLCLIFRSYVRGYQIKIANKLFFNSFESEGTGQLRLFHTRTQKERHYTERERDGGWQHLSGCLIYPFLNNDMNISLRWNFALEITASPCNFKALGLQLFKYHSFNNIFPSQANLSR